MARDGVDVEHRKLSVNESCHLSGKRKKLPNNRNELQLLKKKKKNTLWGLYELTGRLVCLLCFTKPPKKSKFRLQACLHGVQRRVEKEKPHPFMQTICSQCVRGLRSDIVLHNKELRQTRRYGVGMSALSDYNNSRVVSPVWFPRASHFSPLSSLRVHFVALQWGCKYFRSCLSGRSEILSLFSSPSISRQLNTARKTSTSPGQTRIRGIKIQKQKTKRGKRSSVADFVHLFFFLASVCEGTYAVLMRLVQIFSKLKKC